MRPCSVARERIRSITSRVADRAVVPRLVQLLVERGLPVYGASANAPTLEDVYFAVEARIAASEGRTPTPLASSLPNPVPEEVAS